MFESILGNCTGSEYKIEFLEETKPYLAKPFLISKIYKETLKTEVNTLINMRVLNRKNNSEWAAHS